MKSAEEILEVTDKAWKLISESCKTDYETLLVCGDLYATAIAFKHNNQLVELGAFKHLKKEE